MLTTPKMALKVWNLLTDLFDHDQLIDNFVAIDGHDHTAGKGNQIPTGGVQDGAITTAKLASNAVTLSKLDVSARPLVVTPMVAPNTAVSGQFVQATGSGTIILPAPTTSAIVAVRNSNAASGTITVSVSTGLIYGPQFFGASSITLAPLASYVTLIGDGTNWSIIGSGLIPTITGANIAAGSITGSNIAAGTITGGNIASNTITGSNVNTATTLTVANLGVTTTALIGSTATNHLTAKNVNWGTNTLSVPGAGGPFFGYPSAPITHGLTASDGVTGVIPTSIQITPRVTAGTIKAGIVYIGVDHFSNIPTTTTFRAYVISNATDLTGLTFSFDWAAFF